jgi:peptide/nickel transport system permease protein
MREFLIKRILQTIFVFFVVSTVIFFLFRIVPGDPTSMLIDSQMSIEAQNLLRARWGLDKPLYLQYISYLKNLLRGEFGTSFFYGEPVFDLLAEKIINTLFLMGVSISLAIGLGVILGTFLGWKRGHKVEQVGVVGSLFLRSIPIFWTAIVLLAVFAFWLRIFPAGGMRTPGYEAATLMDKYLSWDFVYHLILPVACATLYFVADPMMIMRSSILEVRGEDFLEMARAKGLSEFQVMFKHGARNAILPVVTYTALLTGFAFGGQVLLEVVFAWPGMGREIVLAVDRLDYPVAQASFFLMAMIVILLNFLVDLLYGYLDPRIVYR